MKNAWRTLHILLDLTIFVFEQSKYAMRSIIPISNVKPRKYVIIIKKLYEKWLTITVARSTNAIFILPEVVSDFTFETDMSGM